MTKYTIMLPVYNKIECLKKYFSTVINQNISDYEIIVVDDCSTDGSYEYLKELEKSCNKLIVYRNKKNMGIGYVRNKLISFANGKYLLFVDPDDYIEETLLKELDKYYDLDLDIIRFQNVIEPVGINQILKEQGKDLHRYSCLPTNIISGEEALLLWSFGERKINTFPWTYAIKKDIFNDVKYPETTILEDLAITPYLIAKSNRIKAIDFIGYHYLKYDSSLSTSSSEYAIYKLEVLKQIIELAKLYISTTQISQQTKELYYRDLENRYNIRKEKVYSKIK
ncbi:MAG: glycosyltransferase family 2 protein [Bacilli bacterium]